jgi:hypothetical protein
MRQVVYRRSKDVYLFVPTQKDTHVSTLTLSSVAWLCLGEAGDLWCDVLGGVGGGGTGGHSLVSGRVQLLLVSRSVGVFVTGTSSGRRIAQNRLQMCRCAAVEDPCRHCGLVARLR